MLRRCVVVFLCLLLCVAGWRTLPALAQNSAVTINVDAGADRRPISPLIYGVAYADFAQLSDLNCPLNRSGGNAATRYNWQLNASNRANDWYYESISDGNAVAGEAADTFISDSKAAGAAPMLTVPMIGWVAKLGPNRAKLASFSISKYGPQTGNDWQWFPDAGNGVKSGGGYVTGNDPADANAPADSSFQQDWVRHLTGRWGTAANGGLRYYLLDNEPSIWHATHRDVHPAGATMEEIRDKIFDYAAKIKAVDSSAVVIGPEEWGWSGYLFSGYDQQYGSLHGWGYLPDRASHGGADYLPWLLGQLRQRDAATGQRLLDFFSVHYYPQGGEFSDDVSSAMQLRRNRSTRSLWDPAYTDETWINDRVQLVPRLRGWVAANYPGTKTAVTEYNWGAAGHINGATAQADILGIFGREGLDMATRWTTPAASTPTYKAIKMYRNYDGQKSTFGETSVRASVPNPDSLSAFAAERGADGALTVMIVGKQLSGDTPVTVNLSNFTGAGSAQVWQLTSANAITRLNDITYSGNSLQLSVPAQSVTLLVLPKGAGVPTHTIGGVVRVGSTGLGGVTMTLTSPSPAGFAPRTVTTASTGAYSFTNVPAGRSYTLKPTKTNYAFTPASRSYTNLSANQAGQNFAATVTGYTVSGTVKLGAAGLGGVTVRLSSPTPAGFTTRSTLTSSTGAYSFTNVPPGRSYVVTPTKAGYQFTPANRPLTSLAANQTAVNFLVKVYSISGRVTRTGTTTGIASVTMTLTSPTPANFPARSVLTNSTGNYTFTNVPAGRNYTIKPTKSGFTFSPTARSISNLSANVAAGAATNFTGSGP
ncbi:MAG TPA: glycoside hydrolase family 44 protein [Pyrinomonadaceae bacterium]|nr:glycoside hydrolase family 44 protein [Pyrinomonadaceae bacterium]